MLALGAGVLAGCKKEKNGPLDPSAMLALNAPKEAQANEAATTKAADGEQQRLTPRQVVEKATNFFYYELGEDKTGQPGQGVITDLMRDIEHNRIVFPKGYIIQSDRDNLLNTNFIEGSNFILLINKGLAEVGYPTDHPYYWFRYSYDTVAYIPSRIIKEASAKIKAAYGRGDYAACYKLFEEAYVFYPITGRELKELQERGEE